MRNATIALVLAVLAASFWFWIAEREGTSPPLALPADAPPVAAAPVAKGTVDEASSATTGSAVAREAASAVGDEPRGDVLVVAFGGNQPIVGAHVLFPGGIDWPQLPAELRELANRDDDAFLARVGTRLVTGADGRCRVPFGSAGTRVVATKDGSRAEGWLAKDVPQPLVLALRPDHALRVRVVDVAGQPAPAVQVMARRSGDSPMDFGFGATDAAGVATKPHVQELAGDATACRLDVFARYPGGESPAVRVDALAPPSEVVLRLPATGQVLVHVRDADGNAIDPRWLGNANVTLTTWSERPADRRAAEQGGTRADATAAIDERGDARFANVALGAFVRADVGTWLSSEVVPGPTLVDPRIEVTARENAGSVVFTGTLFDADGRALSSCGYDLSCHAPNGMSGSNARTGVDGRFRICLGAWPASSRATLVFATRPAPGGEPLWCELPPRAVQAGRNDLGDVHLERMKVIAAGRVVGDDLPALRRLPLQFERQRDGHWQGVWNLQPEWRDGRFTLRGAIPAGAPMRVSVPGAPFLPVAPIEFAAGATDLEIPLRRGGTVAVTLLVDVEAVPAHWLHLSRVQPPLARGEQPVGEGWSFGESQRAIDGKVGRTWMALTPGRYRFEVRDDGAAAPLAVVDAIEVAEGPCADPRLAAIDLRGRIRTFAIRAAAADGAAIARRDAFVIVRGGDEWHGFHLGAGVVTLAASAATNLLVVAPGHRAAFVDQVFEARTIALEAAPQLAVAIALPTPVPEGAQLRLRLEPRLAITEATYLRLDTGRGMPARSFCEQDCAVGADGRALVPVCFPGEHTLAVSLRDGRRGVGVACEPKTANLPTSGELAVRVDGDAWQTARAQLQQ